MTHKAKALALPALLVFPLLSSSAAPARSQQSKTQPGTTRPAPPAAQQPAADSLPALAAQAQQALDRKDYDAAIPLLQQIIAQKPGEALPHFELGYAYSTLKRYDDAASEYRRAVEIDPALAAAHLNLGLVLLDSDPTAALASFRRAAHLNPTDGRPHYLEGRALERGGKLPEAVEEYRSAAAMTPKDPAIRLALASALMRTEKFSEAEKQFREALAMEPDSAPAKLGLAEALLREQRLQDANDAYTAYLAQVPNDRDAHFNHAVVLENLDRSDEALAELDHADQSTAPTPESLKLRGSIFIQLKKWPESDAALTKAVAALPADAQVHAWLGRTKMELHDYATAEKELRRALELDPSDLDPLRDLIGVLYLSGNYNATIDAVDVLQKHETLTALNWFFRAISCDKIGRKPEAAADYQKFLELDQGQHPDQDFQAKGRLAVLARELNKK